MNFTLLWIYNARTVRCPFQQMVSLAAAWFTDAQELVSLQALYKTLPWAYQRLWTLTLHQSLKIAPVFLHITHLHYTVTALWLKDKREHFSLKRFWDAEIVAALLWVWVPFCVCGGRGGCACDVHRPWTVRLTNGDNTWSFSSWRQDRPFPGTWSAGSSINGVPRLGQREDHRLLSKLVPLNSFLFVSL